MSDYGEPTQWTDRTLAATYLADLGLPSNPDELLTPEEHAALNEHLANLGWQRRRGPDTEGALRAEVEQLRAANAELTARVANDANRIAVLIAAGDRMADAWIYGDPTPWREAVQAVS